MSVNCDKVLILPKNEQITLIISEENSLSSHSSRSTRTEANQNDPSKFESKSDATTPKINRRKSNQNTSKLKTNKNSNKRILSPFLCFCDQCKPQKVQAIQNESDDEIERNIVSGTHHIVNCHQTYDKNLNSNNFCKYLKPVDDGDLNVGHIQDDENIDLDHRLKAFYRSTKFRPCKLANIVKTFQSDKVKFPSDKKIWCCIFCSKTNSYLELGSLYGPYMLEQDFLENLKLNKPSLDDSSDRFALGVISSNINPDCERIDFANGEYWTHLNCALWAPGVYLCGESKIGGIEEAIRITYEEKCDHCKKSGASISCRKRKCPKKYHYECSILSDCHLDWDNFSIICKEHKD